MNFAPPIFDSIAFCIVGLSFGYSPGSDPCQTYVHPLLSEIKESAVGPVTKTFVVFESGKMLF